MFKRILGLAVVAVMMLAVFGLTACYNVSLEEYKTTKSTELQSYADAKGRDNYCADCWTAICQAVTDGKSAIEAATSKPAVNTAVEDAKAVINKVKKEKGLVEIEVEDMIELRTWHFTSGVPNNVIVVKYSDENAIFECSVDNGNLWLFGPEYEKKLTVKSNESFRWQTEEEGTNFAFIDIILKLDDRIIGYAVIEISKIDNPYNHTARLLKSALFPKIDGEYQSVTEMEVKLILGKIKEDNLV